MNTAKQHSLCLKNIWLWSFSVTLPTENFHAKTLQILNNRLERCPEKKRNRVVSDDRKIPLFAAFTAAGQL